MHTYILLLHILCATIWTGGHLILAFSILPRALKAHEPKILLDFEQGYEKIGMPALILQVLSGLWLAYQYEPIIANWFTIGGLQTNFIALKLACLGLTVMLALNARLRIIPNLTTRNLPLMGWHIRGVTALSVLFVVAGVGISQGGF